MKFYICERPHINAHKSTALNVRIIFIIINKRTNKQTNIVYNQKIR